METAHKSLLNENKMQKKTTPPDTQILYNNTDTFFQFQLINVTHIPRKAKHS